MKIYLIRHGQTAANKEKRFVGWRDVDLTPQGCRQAEKVAEFFLGKPVAEIYSSDLLRAVRTAEIIGKNHGLKPKKNPLLREIHFGEWEGFTYKEIMGFSEKEMRRWYDNPFKHSPPGGESLQQVSSRMDDFLSSLAAPENNDEAIILVSHGGAIRSILHRYLGLGEKEIWDITIDNTSVSLMQKSGTSFEVVFVNDLRHMQER